MRVLILGSESPLGQALGAFLDALGRHEVESITRSASRWKSERQAKKAVRRAKRWSRDTTYPVKVERDDGRVKMTFSDGLLVRYRRDTR